MQIVFLCIQAAVMVPQWVNSGSAPASQTDGRSCKGE